MRTTHDCAAEGCTTQCKTGMLMCRKHWFMVPKPLRDDVWSGWNNGRPRPHYRSAVANAIEAVKTRETA